MRVLLLTQFFPPEIGAAAERMGSLARFIADRAELTVLAPVPSYPWSKTIKKKEWPAEDADGRPYRLKRCYKIPKRGNLVIRLLSEIHYAGNCLLHILIARRYDLIIISIPSFFLGFVGPVMRWLRGSEYVLDIRDLYPDSLKDVGILQEGVVYRLLKRAEAGLYRRAKLVSIVNETWQPAIAKHARDVVVVPNGLDLDQLPSRKAIPPSLTAQQQELLASRFVVVYIGNIGRFYDFDPFLSAAADIGQADVKRILFLFVGEGSQRTELENRIKAQTVKNCAVWDPIPSEFLISFLGLCHIGIVGWRANTRFLENGVPNKVYEYLAADLDVIACIPGTLPGILTASGRVHQFANQDRAGIVAKILKIQERGGKIQTPPDLLETFSRKRHFSQLWSHIEPDDSNENKNI